MAGHDNPPTYSEAVQVLTREIQHKYGIDASDVGRAVLMGNSDVVAIFPPKEHAGNHRHFINQSPSAVTSPTSPRTGSIPGGSATPERPASEINSTSVHQGNIDNVSYQSGVGSQRRFRHPIQDPMGVLDQKSREHSSHDVHPGNSRPENVGADQISSESPNQPIRVVAYPLSVSFEHDYLEIPHNCTQTDINWDPPANADLFEGLIYKLQIMVSRNSQTVIDWEDVAECTNNQIRVYRIEEVVMINRKRYRRLFGNPPKPFGVDVKLRIRAEGVPKDLEVTRRGVWSEITLRLWRETS
ncbi:uncharacterized protein [Haliotis asinina]|uniref:uncharacterized protein n=1 Tax=Haliotis asinina TaxID=109174 RepID=UPI003531A74E